METQKVEKKQKVEKAPKEPKAPKKIGIEFKIAHGGAEKAAQEYFDANLDEEDGITVKVEACGTSIRYPDYDQFPKKNRTCACGQRGHYSIKYTIA